MTQAERIAAGLEIHPRVAQQRLGADDAGRARMAAALPPLVPFRGPGYGAFVAVLDWDHRLPSKTVTLRVWGCYGEATAASARRAVVDRLDRIREVDRHPEFDVPDFEGIEADEVYEADLTLEGGLLECRHVSPWRREIAEDAGRAATEAVGRSPEFEGVLAGAPDHRVLFFGEPRAVQWVAPFETAHGRWTLDVWYLLDQRGKQVSGRSFLVDLDEDRVVAVRELTLRVT